MPRKKKTLIEIPTEIHYCPETATSEHDLQKKCVARLRAHNFIVSCNDVFNAISYIPELKKKAIYKGHIQKMGGTVGFPDITVLDYDRQTTFVEFKYGNGKLSADQVAVHALLKARGYEVLIWKTENECVEWILSKLRDAKEKQEVNE